MSATPDSTLANPEQLIADLQRQLAEREAELAECKAERDAALQRETATAEVLQVINSSPGDLVPVFDAILEKATRVCEAVFGTLSIWDGERFHWVGFRGLPAELVEALHQVLMPVGDRRPVADRIVRGEMVISTPDLREAEWRGMPVAQAFLRHGARSCVTVALRQEERLLGLITIYREEVRPFSDKQIALLQNFAAQAVIAMENARLLTETREALEQQTATAEVLGVINASPGDLAPVFDAMLERATALCGAAFGTLATYDGERFAPAAAYGVPPAFAAFRAERGAFAPPPGSSLERVAIGESLVHIADVMTDPGQAATPLVKLGGCRSLLCVALRKDDTLIGAITAYRQEVRPFTDKQIALLQNFAAQAVIAMENARLITETREALEQQTATAEVLQVINLSPGDLAPVFDAILEKAHTLCAVAHGALELYDGETFRAVATRGLPESFAERVRKGYRGAENPISQQLLSGARFVHIPDAAEVGNELSVLAAELGGLRTSLFVPLRKDNKLLGQIIANRTVIRPFTAEQIALLENFAAQAVIAMDNARLITETREALEQQTATAEVLQVINSSPGDLTPVFDAMLEKATRLCEAPFGTLRTWDGERFHLAAVHGDPRFIEWAWDRGSFAPADDGSPLARIIKGEGVVRFADAPNDAGYIASPGFREMVEISGMRSGVAVSLRKDDTLLGNLTVYRQEVRPFTDEQTALLQNFAAQAVIAMENARLITETREALEQQTATAEVLGVINSSPGDLAPVFDAMLENATTLCDAAFGIMLTWDGQCFHRVAFRGASAELIAALREPNRPVSGSMASQIVDGAGMICAADIRDEPAYRIPGAAVRSLVDIGGARSYVAVALRKDDVLLGILSAYRQEVRPFSDKQVALLQNFAAQAVIAMENARLLGELRQRTEEVAELNRGLEARVAEQVDELGRVGRLKRFLAPQLAELIVSQGDEKILESHRREIVVVFCDLRGYTAFTETAEPEEVLDFLREYHGALGPLVAQFEGTLDQFSGDGIMVFFNDPVPCPDPAERAVKMAMAMREAAGTLIAHWRERGRDLGFGACIAQGYATLGQIGFSERSGYTAIGTVCNVAARFCAEAKDGQILLSQLVNVALKGSVATEQLGPLALKGLTQSVVAYNVPLAAIQPALRVIEGGPQSV